MNSEVIENPFRPGAGHLPPYLAGRDQEEKEFKDFLSQKIILQNVIITGLRGVGKTVLLETLKPIAISDGWFWVGTEMSESACVDETTMAVRLITDLSVITSTIFIPSKQNQPGFNPQEAKEILNFSYLLQLYSNTPGLVSDKLKNVLEFVWSKLRVTDKKGVIFAYDEAQSLSDHIASKQYPLAMLLDVFQSIQRKEIPFMLVLTGLPTLFPKLVEARTYTERMFHIMTLDRLNEKATKDAIVEPINKKKCPISFNEDSIDTVFKISSGYPYFIQFICKEVFDIWVQQSKNGVQNISPVPTDDLIRKLDSDFYSGRWAQVTDRQRELLNIIAHLPNGDTEFAVQEIVVYSKEKTTKPFGSSHVSQMLTTLIEAGLIYKNRFGKYSFAVPLLNQFVLRQEAATQKLQPPLVD